MATKSIATTHPRKLERNSVGSEPVRPAEVHAEHHLDELRLGRPSLAALRRQRTRAGLGTLGGFLLIFAGAFFAPTQTDTAPQLLHLPFAAAALLGFAVVVNSLSNVIAKTRALRQVRREANLTLDQGD